MIVVPPAGRQPNEVLICGEAPGKEESIRLEPFVGKSGQAQEWYLRRHGLSARRWRRTNVVQEYRDGNPDPEPNQIAYWTPVLIRDVLSTNPRLIVAVGRFAAEFFLGDGLFMEDIHGLPHRPGQFDPSRASRAPHGCIILPIYHVAWSFRGDEKSQARAKVIMQYDYAQVADTLRKIRRGDTFDFREDLHKGDEDYRDVTGKELEYLISSSYDLDANEIGMDTEGTPGHPWSIQVSWREGTGYTLRTSQPDFSRGIGALARLQRDHSPLWITHCAQTPQGAMYDLLMSRLMGLNLSRARVWDCMYALYLLRTEPLGLKAAALRWCGMYQEPYMDLIGDIAKGKQITYLEQIACRTWDRPDARILTANDGTSKLYRPSKIENTVKKILADIASGKVNKDGDPADPYKRWMDIDSVARSVVEKEIGVIPTATLDDIPLEKAVYYGSRDADIDLRLKRRLLPELERLDLVRTMNDGCDILPVFEEMQWNGMPASRSRFTELHDYLDHEYFKTINKISRVYCGGKPFNPRSNPQTNDLLNRLGLQSTKRTKTGLQSTSKKSIEHLRYKHPAISLLFEAREYAHMRDSFCRVFLDTFPPEVEIHDVRSVFKPANTETRRLAAEDPNILNVPARTELGQRVKGCFIARHDGEVFMVADLSQIELRVLADESRDEILCRVFLEDRSVHKETACRLFGISNPDLLSKVQYTFGKTINFGITYGMSYLALYEQCRMQGIEDMDEKACEKAIPEWYKIYKGVARYKADLVRQAEKDGYIRDRGGMYRYLPNLQSRDRKERAEAERHTVSHRIQGTAQTMIQRSMGWIKRQIWELQDSGLNIIWRCQYHDELDFTGDEWLEPIVRDIVIEGLTEHCGIKLRVPVLAGWSTGRSWADAK